MTSSTDSPFDTQGFADALTKARRERRQIAPPVPGPRDVEDSYRVQDLVAAALGPVAAWKAGAKTPTDDMVAAPIPRDLVRPSPAEWDAASFSMIGIEAEIAFRIAVDLAPNPSGLARDEALAAIGSVHPVIEIVDTRMIDWRNAAPLVLLADAQNNGGLVVGAGIEDWRGLDLANAPVRLDIDGRTAHSGRGGNTAGDPVRVVAWTIDHCVRRRGGLAAGTLITTGTCTGMIFVEPGARIAASFADLGEVGVSFTSSDQDHHA